MTFLFPLLAKWGIPEKLRAPVQWAIIAALVIAGFFAVKAMYDSSVVEEHEEEKAIATIEARDDAAEARADDAIRNTLDEKETLDVIEAAPKGGTLSPAARALACKRLRDIGRVPPACGPEGGDGS